MQEKVKKLLDIVSDQEKAELTTLNNAMVSTIRNYRENPTATNKRNWDAAKEGLESRVDQLWEKYSREGGHGESKLKNIPAVIHYLEKAGWKISKSAAYKHKKEGKLRPGQDGTFSVKAVEKYAKRWLEKKDGSEGLDDLQEATAKAQLEKLQAQARHWDTKTKIELGEYVHRNQWDRELAARARVFKSDMENFIRAQASEITRIVEGDPEKAPDLIEFYLEHLEVWLNRYSKHKTWKTPGKGKEEY